MVDRHAVKEVQWSDLSPVRKTDRDIGRAEWPAFDQPNTEQET